MSAAEKVIQQALSLHKAKKFDEALHLYNCVLNRDAFDERVLFLLSDIYLRQEYTGLAVNLLTNVLHFNPKHGAAWCNLGIAFRKENNYDKAKECWEKSIDVQGETVEVCSNLAGLYADRAEPLKAIEWCDRALKLDPVNVEARWQKALALLTLKDWSSGWDLYENRQKLETWDRRASITAPLWDFALTDHLYIHGEQGVGDEVMFLSCLPDVLPLAKRITLEVHPAVAGIVRQTWPQVSVVTTETQGDYTAKIPLGSLACRLRRSAEAFPGTAFLKPDPVRVEAYRQKLAALGPRPWVAVTWLGGVKATRVEERSMNLHSLRPILDSFTCVSAQYEHILPVIAKERAQERLVALDDACLGTDIAAQAALFAAVDAVVTVQQTAVHVAGAVGAKTFAMIGNTPHWRYGLSGDMPWYDSVKLYRKSSDWDEVINRVRSDLADQFGVSGAKRKAA